MSDKNKDDDKSSSVTLQDTSDAYQILKRVFDRDPTPHERTGFGAALKMSFLKAVLGKLQPEYDKDPTPDKETLYYGAAIVIRVTTECEDTMRKAKNSLAVAGEFYDAIQQIGLVSTMMGTQYVNHLFSRLPLDIVIGMPHEVYNTLVEMFGDVPGLDTAMLERHPFIRAYPHLLNTMQAYSIAMSRLRVDSMIDEICEPEVYAGAMMKVAAGYGIVNPLRPVGAWRPLQMDGKKLQEFLETYK
jgi:hypothetical protein